MALAVSTAKLDITPPAGTDLYMAGYGEETPRTATGTYAPLMARCVVFWDNGSPNCIAVADILLFPRSVHQAIRQRLVPLNGLWSSSDIVLATTHTHNGPALVDVLNPYITYGLTDTTLLQSYGSWLQDRMVALVQTALAAPSTPCTLDYSVAQAGFSANREGLPYTETDVPVLVARSVAGQPLAVLFSYGCHPVSATVQTLWDGDFPSGACSAIETAIPGSFAMFLPGPGGDQDPTGTRGWSLRNQHATRLGSAVVAAARTPGRPVAGPILTAYREVNLPLDVTDTPANMVDVKAAFQARLANPDLGPLEHRHAELMIKQVQDHTYAKQVPLPLQVWKLQGAPGLQMAFTAGELVSGYGVYFRKRFGGSAGLYIGGYANEVPSYLPSDQLLPPDHPGGSYAGGWSPDYPGIGGGSMTIYAYLAHYLRGAGGVESTLISALSAMLA